MADKVKYLRKINPAKAIEEMLREQDKKLVQILGEEKDSTTMSIVNVN